VEELPLQEPEKVVLNALRHDEAVQLDELMESLESKLTSSEIFTALFELELASRIKQLPGKNYVRRM
jgi:DNA processing protein